MVEKVDPKTIALWLEWAAVRLIALPAGRIYPAEPRAAWPDFYQEILPGASDLRTNRIRALAPSAAEIPVVDEIMILPNLCAQREVRQILHWRAQVHPIRGNHLLDWNWIANKLKIKVYTAKNWHKKGLAEVAEKVPKPTVCRISAFLTDRL